jgi:lysophospholipase L1-like esterase
LFGPGGNALSTQTNAGVAVGGSYAYAIGNSNTNGVGDNFAGDNALVARVRGAQGYAGTLTARLDTISPFNIVYNEGIGGDTSEAARFVRLGSLQERHSRAERALINLGTNDAGANRASGELCAPNDAACLDDTVRGDLQAIIDELNADQVEVWISTVPPAWTDTSPSATSPRISRTRGYNRAITGGLTGVNLGPDLFDGFFTDVDGDGTPDLKRRSLFADALHFNALGHSIVSILWYNALVGDSTGTSIVPFMLSEPSVAGYQQNLIESGDRYLVDSQATVTSFPAALEGGIWVMTRQGDAGNASGSFLSFSVADRPVDVYVAYDAAATGLPGWLDPAASGFTAVGGAGIQTSAGSYRLYVRSYAAGETVTLGGNAAAGAAGAGLMYLPVVVDASP